MVFTIYNKRNIDLILKNVTKKTKYIYVIMEIKFIFRHLKQLKKLNIIFLKF